MLNYLLIPIGLYLIVLALMFFSQRSLLYLPDHRYVSKDELEAFGLSRWPDDDTCRGYLADRPSAELTIVVFHGNAGSAIDRLYYAEAFGFLSARLLLAEYPGYGGRQGQRTQNTLVRDARETLTLVQQQFPDQPLYVVGESLGAAVAAGALGSDEPALAKPPVDGLLLLTPWNTLTAVAAHHYRFLPVELLLTDRYPSDRWLADVSTPKVVVIAGRDEVVPAMFGRALFDSLPEPKRISVVEDAHHNDWFQRVDRQWWHELWQQLQTRR